MNTTKESSGDCRENVNESCASILGAGYLGSATFRSYIRAWRVGKDMKNTA